MGYIIVTPTPYYSETDESGSFEIKNVPDGSYVITAWHEGYKTQTRTIMVGGDARIQFTLVK